jgi:histidine triad (HIT) family protein
VGEICRLTGVQPGEGGEGFRAITNAGEHGVQEVPHYHLHILGGRALGRMLARAKD